MLSFVGEFNFTPVPMAEPSNEREVFPATKSNILHSRFQLDIATPRGGKKWDYSVNCSCPKTIIVLLPLFH